MASVKFELRNEGKGLHEWDYVPLCEPRVVRMQVENRSTVDRTYTMKLYECSQLMSQGVAPMSEPITASYIDLDRLIDTCGLTDSERKVIELLMQGYTKSDIKDMAHVEMPVVTKLYDAAVEKIVDRNNFEWKRTRFV